MSHSCALQKKFNELIIEARKLFEVLDESSKIVKNLEDQLKQSKLHFPFSYVIESKGAYKNVISWDVDEHNNYRLMVTEIGDSGSPLIETNIQTRLKFIPHLDSFLREFTIYLIQKRSDILRGNI